MLCTDVNVLRKMVALSVLRQINLLRPFVDSRALAVSISVRLKVEPLEPNADQTFNKLYLTRQVNRVPNST